MPEWKLTTELLFFETRWAFQEDLSVCVPAFDLVLSADGAYEPGWYGKQIENANTGYVFCNWESYEAHQKVLAGPIFPQVKELLLKSTIISWDDTEMVHVIFSDEPTATFRQPVTEVIIFTLKSPARANRTAAETALAKISAMTNKMFVYGETIEDASKYVAVCGWPSLKAQRDAFSRPEMVAQFKELYRHVNKEHDCHTRLSELAPYE